MGRRSPATHAGESGDRSSCQLKKLCLLVDTSEGRFSLPQSPTLSMRKAAGESRKNAIIIRGLSIRVNNLNLSVDNRYLFANGQSLESIPLRKSSSLQNPELIIRMLACGERYLQNGNARQALQVYSQNRDASGSMESGS